MRKLSEEFYGSLINEDGILFPILQAVKCDFTLDLEIRHDYIDIYYRGGCISSINRSSKDEIYAVKFNHKYLSTIISPFRAVIKYQEEAKEWVMNYPKVKHQMDLWFTKHKKSERDYQQRIVYENNLGTCSNDTDYYICDIEYKHKQCEFDLIGIKWLSTSESRKRCDSLGLSIIELKYGDKSISVPSGILKHYNDMANFIRNKEKVHYLKAEMLELFRQKHKLGFINVKKVIQSIENPTIEVLFILANHKPASRQLLNELEKIRHDDSLFDLKFAYSNFMGYGIYDKNLYTLSQMKDKLKG
jgi:hypothetical protein